METKRNTKVIRAIRLDPEQIQRLSLIAAREERTFSGEVRKLIADRIATAEELDEKAA